MFKYLYFGKLGELDKICRVVKRNFGNHGLISLKAPRGVLIKSLARSSEVLVLQYGSGILLLEILYLHFCYFTLKLPIT